MSVRIGFGVANFSFDDARAFWRWIDLCDEMEVDSLWFSERMVSRYAQLEPITAMAAVAGRTKHVKFGMNATVLPVRDPLVLAKELATVDFLSGGRVLPVYGVGGAMAPEYTKTGRLAKGRGRLADEMLEIMTRLFREDNVSYEGEHFQYRDVSITPKPIQSPLPTWIGGSSAAAIRRTATFGDGWLAGLQSAEQVKPVVSAIKAASADAGRPVDPDHYGAGFSFRFGSPEEPVVQRTVQALSRIESTIDPSTIIAAGDADTIIERCKEYYEAGISKFVLRPLATDDDDTLAQTQRLVDEVRPVVEAWATPV